MAGKTNKKHKTPSAKEQAFIHEYIRDFNGAAAARRAGYSPKNARQQATRMLAKAYIKAYLEELLIEIRNSAKVESADMLLLCQEIMLADVTDYYDADTGLIKLDADSPNKRAIGHVKTVTRYDKDGEPIITRELRLRDPIAAMERLARLKGLDKPKINKHTFNIKYVGRDKDKEK